MIDWAHGAFVLVRREAFDAVGGFDTDQWMYAEDLDLAWRLARAGRPTRFVPAARVRHEVAAATSQRFADDERAAQHMAAAQDWMARRRGRAVARAYAGDQRARVRGAARGARPAGAPVAAAASPSAGRSRPATCACTAPGCAARGNLAP